MALLINYLNAIKRGLNDLVSQKVLIYFKTFFISITIFQKCVIQSDTVNKTKIHFKEMKSALNRFGIAQQLFYSDI